FYLKTQIQSPDLKVMCKRLTEGSRGRSGLVVRCQLRDWRVPGSKPDSTEDPLRMRAWCSLNLTSWVERPPDGVVRKFGEAGG
ncbi:hypothetical protein AVEN_44404-1, partial [Araneus ventricosus]